MATADTDKNINGNVNGVVYFIPDLERFEPLLLSAADATDSAGLLFEKELIHVGQFVKEQGKQRREFQVTEPALHHWKNTHGLMLAHGIKTPMPKGHSFDPEKNRGELLDITIKPNKKGKMAAYGKLKFRDTEAAKMAQTADVSVYVTDEYTDGTDNYYFKPIRHVALTDYPVIPGLEGFQAIQCSYYDTDTGNDLLKEHSASALLPVAQQLGVQQPELMSEAGMVEAILGVFQMMKDELQKLKSKVALSSVVPNTGDSSMPTDTTTPNVRPKMPPAFAASFKNMLKDSRKQKLDALVQSGNILPIVRDDLALAWCGDACIDSAALALENVPDDADLSKIGTDAAFDSTIEALKKNKALKFNEKTGPQIPGAVALSHDMGAEDEDSILVRDAEKRAKEFNLAHSNGR